MAEVYMELQILTPHSDYISLLPRHVTSQAYQNRAADPSTSYNYAPQAAVLLLIESNASNGH